MTESAAIMTLKTLIPRAWHPFLARFGKPTPIQLHGIPAIMEGHDTLLIAPTASGKTEAYAAPIAETISSGPGPAHLSTWIVSPTRALVNDLTRRLIPPIEAMGLKVGRRTGEHREISGPGAPHVVITTPESLDSMLARSPSLFLEAGFVVLDEVHMVDAQPRGDQLACLVSRMRHIAPGLQVIASSATIDDPSGLAVRYLGDDSRIIKVPGERPIKADFIRNSAGVLASALRRITSQDKNVRKALVFVRRRADAERLFKVFKGRPPFGDAVYLHHGSLSRNRRETVERMMLTGSSGLCFATTTLEVGIDIGDIDLIVLTTPPTDVSTFLQRIGRGSRRTSVTRVFCLFSDEGQIMRYKHLLHAAGKGCLLGSPYHFCPSVLVQQCMSLLMQTPSKWLSAKALESRMPAWLRQSKWSSRLPELLDHLTNMEWLIAGRGRYFIGEKLEEAFESGLVHSNIENGSNEIAVVDQNTRQVLGTLPGMPTIDDRLLLNGRNLKVSRTQGRSRVLVTDSMTRADLRVMTVRGPIMHAGMARDLARFIGLDANQCPAIHMEDGSFALFHFSGDLWGALLDVLIKDLTGKKPIKANAFCLQLDELPDAFPLNVSVEKIRSIAIRHRFKLRNNILEGRWSGDLPADWRQIHLIACLNIEGFIRMLKGMRIEQTILSPMQHDALVSLVG